MSFLYAVQSLSINSVELLDGLCAQRLGADDAGIPPPPPLPFPPPSLSLSLVVTLILIFYFCQD
jgi:hypothetical protein